MSLDISTINIWISAGIGLVSGIAASLFAPWANWGVEKKKKRLEGRKFFIEDCKRIIGKKDFELSRFLDSPLYLTLSQYLKLEIRKEVEKKTDRFSYAKKLTLNEELKLVQEEQLIKKKLLREVAKLEKNWGLL